LPGSSSDDVRVLDAWFSEDRDLVRSMREQGWPHPFLYLNVSGRRRMR